MIILKANMNENMAWVEVVHTGGGPMAVELSVFERHIELDGETRMAPMVPSKDFTVYPAQIILRPGEKPRVQLMYTSKQRVVADRAYLLFSKEVPLPMEGDRQGVNMAVSTLMEYYSIIAFQTDKPGKLTFVSSKAIGGGMVEVLAENRSQGRVPVDNLIITVGGKDRISDFTGKKNSVMPGQTRRFTFKYARPLTAKETTFGYPQRR
jgi:fimbrial chaperone protein